jgi:hypothetical protein
MRAIKYYVFLALMLFGFMPASAQVYNDLSEQIADAAKQQVAQFTDCLSFIVDKEQTAKNRNEFREDALKLFIGQGKVYYDNVLDKDGNIIDKRPHKPVTMEVTSLRNPKPKKKTVAEYLLNLVNLANQKTYRSVSITSTQWHDMKVSQVRKIAEDQYVCDVYFEQIFESRGLENRLIYTDKTTKRVTVYIKILHTDYGDEFVILLGDIQATETKKNV